MSCFSSASSSPYGTLRSDFSTSASSSPYGTLRGFGDEAQEVGCRGSLFRANDGDGVNYDDTERCLRNARESLAEDRGYKIIVNLARLLPIPASRPSDMGHIKNVHVSELRRHVVDGEIWFSFRACPEPTPLPHFPRETTTYYFSPRDGDEVDEFWKEVGPIAAKPNPEKVQDDVMWFLEHELQFDAATMDLLRARTGEFALYDAGSHVGSHNVPDGWFRVKLTFDGEERVSSGWEYVYHGTDCKNLLSIARDGLLVPGNRTSDGDLVEIREGHIPGENHIFTSPSYIYASHFIYATPRAFVNQRGEKKFAQVLFQVRAAPGSYRIQGNTLHPSCWPSAVTLDPNFRNDGLEWVHDEPHLLVPFGLCVRFLDSHPREWFAERLEQLTSAGGFDSESDEREVDDSVVTRFFPCNPYNDEQQLQAQNQQAVQEQKKVLWVDDNPQNNAELETHFREKGLIIVDALSTTAALAAYDREPEAFFAVITDMHRLENSKDNHEAGMELSLALRVDRSFSAPIYVYSSYASQNFAKWKLYLESGASKICSYRDILFFFDPKRVTDVPFGVRGDGKAEAM